MRGRDIAVAIRQNLTSETLSRSCAKGGVSQVDDNVYGYGIPPDRGCEFAPRCTECPLPVCVEDAPFQERDKMVYRLTPAAQRRKKRDMDILGLRAEGKTQADIARVCGTSPKTVQRVLRIGGYHGRV